MEGNWVLRALGAMTLAVAALLGSAVAAAACEPFTFDDTGFGLERGIQWAFTGSVVREEPNEETGRPNAVVIRVDKVLAGRHASRELRIQQDDGCDGFWYRLGDRVVVAVPFHPGFAHAPSPSDRLRAPFENVTNYVIAVWVLDGERVVVGPGPHSWPAINGHSPKTFSKLEAALARLPDTSTAGPPAGGLDDPWIAVVLLTAAGAWLASLSHVLHRGQWRRRRRQPASIR
jgi:hypothetical protein